MSGCDLNQSKVEWALKSGFPFENDVERLLKQVLPQHCTVERNHEFEVLNEGGENVIRSIDFLCSVKKKSRNIPVSEWNRGNYECVQIHVLLDAKFSSDENYLFLPTTYQETQKWPYLIPYLEIKDYLDQPKRHFRSELLDFADMPEVAFSSNGQKVKEINKERDSVSAAALQVVQGLTHLFEEKANLMGTTEKDSHFSRNAHYFLPIVVTNSPLWMVKKDVGVEEVKSSQDNSFLESHQSIALQIPKTPQFIKSLSQAKQALSRSFSARQHKLCWYSGGVDNLHILFCAKEGLRDFLKNLVEKFEALQTYFK